MSAPMSEQQLAEIRGRIDGLDSTRTCKGGEWKSSPVDAKSVLPPQVNFAVEDVLKTKHSVIRSSVATFADEWLAEFVAHAREDVPALLAEVERLRSELAKYVGHEPTLAEEAAYVHRANVLGEVTDRLASRATLYGDSRTVNEVINDLTCLAEGQPEPAQGGAA